MDEEFWETWANLRAAGRKDLAREYVFLARRRQRIEREHAKWVTRAKAFTDELAIASLQLDLDSWGKEDYET